MKTFPKWLSDALTPEVRIRLDDVRLGDFRLGDFRLDDVRLDDVRLGDFRLGDFRLGDVRLDDVRLGDFRLGDFRLGDFRLVRLDDVRLSDVRLDDVRLGYWEDYFDVLLRVPNEVPGLIAALKAGTVDGSTYTGKCACLCGTIANLQRCFYTAIPNLAPDASRPIERFFAAIRKGSTPETNPWSKQAVIWAEEFLALAAKFRGDAEWMVGI